MPARLLNSSPAKCGTDPTPNEAIVSVDGFSFASLISSTTFEAGTAGLRISGIGSTATMLIGVKLCTGSHFTGLTSGVVTMVVRANMGVPSSGVIINTASITDSTGLTATGTVTTPVLVPGLELVKTVEPPVAVPNTPITYVITLTNTGQVPFDTLGLVLTDTLPQGFNYVPGSSSPSEPTVVAEPLLRWNNLGTLGVGDHLQVRFAVTTTSAITLGIHKIGRASCRERV